MATPFERWSPTPAASFAVAWGVFWALLATVALQDHLRHGLPEPWRPLLWEGTSFLVASLLLALAWREIPRQDALLATPARWMLRPLLLLPLVAPVFVTLVFGLRHGVLALLGRPYRHDPWPTVYAYESAKFAIFYLLFMAVFFGLRSFAAMQAARVRAESERALAREAQLAQLAQQIEPHFLFNALNTVAATVHDDPDLAERLIVKLSVLLRAATDLTRDGAVALDDELRLLEAYVEIMRQRFVDRVHVRWRVDAAARACRVPALLLQPLLENAFRHGVERHPGAATIEVGARRDGERLLLWVVDDIGRLAGAPVFGVGLGNVRRRLALAHGDGAAALHLSARVGGGVEARIEMPCGC